MFKRQITCLLLAACCLAGFGAGVSAAEVDCDATYCFSGADFSQEEEPLTGICVLSLPDVETGTVMLGTRVLRPGDILTADQIAQLTFNPLRTEEDRQASVTYLPIYEDHVAAYATMTISIFGKEDKAPVAEDFAMETYKNLANEGTLKVKDPEGQPLTYTITRQPRRHLHLHAQEEQGGHRFLHLHRHGPRGQCVPGSHGDHQDPEAHGQLPVHRYQPV